MATVKPFAALRPKPELAARICELPYDVLSSAEARKVAHGNPLSFFHVSKPEIDLPPDVSLYDDKVYQKGEANFKRLIADGALQKDSKASFYLYRQVMGDHAQLGLVAITRCEEYQRGIIKRHELTRVDKEDDRVRHMQALQAQTGPAFLVYKSDPILNGAFARRTVEQPEIDFVADDGVRHTSWCVTDSALCRTIENQFAAMPSLYIADGHHRTAAAARLAQNADKESPRASFLSVLFPHDQVRILPYHRVLKDLNGMSAAELLQRLDAIFIIRESGAAQPGRRHELGLFLENRWLTLTFRPHFAAAKDPIEKLDATLLQKYVLAPLFGIDDPRTSQRIGFVGGIRGTGELEKLVRAGESACAFAMYPTSVDELMTIADAGGIMPPKSTWFEPKLRDGMFSHLFV
jgi:uncharacterized protein (DUF1015 family)